MRVISVESTELFVGTEDHPRQVVAVGLVVVVGACVVVVVVDADVVDGDEVTEDAG